MVELGLKLLAQYEALGTKKAKKAFLLGFCTACAVYDVLGINGEFIMDFMMYKNPEIKVLHDEMDEELGDFLDRE